MALKKLSGTKGAVEWQADGRADAPSIMVHDQGRATFKSLAVRLLGLTALTGKEQLDAVRAAAAQLSDSDEIQWTAIDVHKLLNAVGAIPTPTHVTLETLVGQGCLLFRATSSDAPKARQLRYPKGSGRPELSVLTAMRQEGIKLPKGMSMEVPVKLSDDVDGLTLVANFRRGRLHNSMESSRQETPQSVMPARQKLSETSGDEE